MPIYIGDYLTATSHLSTTGHGAYLLLIFHYWTTKKELPQDDKRLARIARLSLDEWMEIKPEILDFFIPTATGWEHKRIESEMDKARKFSRNRKESGRKGAEKRWGKGPKVVPFEEASE